MRLAGQAQAPQRLFWRWKLRRPQRTQSVWVLFLLFPKLPVPLPCNYNKNNHEKNVRRRRRQGRGLEGGVGGCGSPFLRRRGGGARVLREGEQGGGWGLAKVGFQWAVGLCCVDLGCGLGLMRTFVVIIIGDN